MWQGLLPGRQAWVWAGWEVKVARLSCLDLALWPGWQDSAQSSREQKESGLGRSQRRTWANGTIRGPPDYAVILRDHRSPEESQGFSSTLISPVKKIRPETYSRAVTGDSQMTNRFLGFCLPPLLEKYAQSMFSLSLPGCLSLILLLWSTSLFLKTPWPLLPLVKQIP